MSLDVIEIASAKDLTFTPRQLMPPPYDPLDIDCVTLNALPGMYISQGVYPIDGTESQLHSPSPTGRTQLTISR